MKIDVDMIEGYEEWKIDKAMFPPQYTPREYAAEMEKVAALEMIEEIRNILQSEDSTYHQWKKIVSVVNRTESD